MRKRNALDFMKLTSKVFKGYLSSAASSLKTWSVHRPPLSQVKTTLLIRDLRVKRARAPCAGGRKKKEEQLSSR